MTRHSSPRRIGLATTRMRMRATPGASSRPRARARVSNDARLASRAPRSTSRDRVSRVGVGGSSRARARDARGGGGGVSRAVVVVARAATKDDDGKGDSANASRESDDEESDPKYQLVTFFRFADVRDPEAEAARHRARVEREGWELRGRIYINEQGINAQMSGRKRDGEAYARWVESDPRFSGMRISVYPADAQAHPRLSLRYKPNLVQLEGGTDHLPLTDRTARAKPLSPKEWHDNLIKVNEKAEDAPLLLDVRNGYEWDVGRFRGAERPVQESFRETVYTNVQEGLGPLANVEKDRPIMMYCTGGIRCDVYSTVLREQGYSNVMTLEGGVQAYFDEYGKRDDQLWDDHLFVFDSRLAMAPDGRPSAEHGEAAATLRCYCCGEHAAPPPHRNCPNVDCNRLFLVCDACQDKLDGFCCEACTKSSHVRPQLVVPGRYEKYSNYDSPESRAARRGPGRSLRKQRRRLRRKLELAAYVLEHMTNVDESRARLVQATGGTFADRTRSLVDATRTVVSDDDDDDEDENTDDEDYESNTDEDSGERRSINPALSRYSKQRKTLREAYALLAEDERTPEKLIQAAEQIAEERKRMKRRDHEETTPVM